MTPWYRPWVLGGAITLASGAGMVYAQDSPPPNDKYVTRQEYDKLQSKLDTVLKEVTDLKKEKGVAPSAADTQAYLEEVDKEMAKIRALTLANASGQEHFLITGDIGANFTTSKGSTSTFGAGFSPLLMWELNDRIFVEAGLDMGLGNDIDGTNGSTDTELSIADISYVINDYLTGVAGLFVTPFGQYHPHFDPRWINRFSDDPLAFGDDALGPGSQVGLMFEGAAPLTYDAKVNYAVYATNGPSLNTSSNPGALDFSNFTDANNGKAIGGRIGFLPIPGMEFGYSAQFAQVNPSNSSFTFEDTTALLQAVDFNFTHEITPLSGVMIFRAEWIFSSVSKATYGNNVPPGQSTFTPMTFESNRNGGYAMVSYRPSRVSNKYLKNVEFLFRYDRVQVPGPPGSGYIQRYTPGIDYWITPSTVFKLAYDFYDSHSPSTTNINGLTAEFDIGF